MKTYTVRIEIEREDDGRWSVWAPDLSGCVSWGNTQEEALVNIQEAVAVYIETLIRNRMAVPASVVISEQPAVSVTVPAA